MRNLTWVVALTLMSGAASAAEQVVVDGELRGATGVNVGGTLYDVTFVDGTCGDLFDDCDAVEDFVFQDGPSAEAASFALRSQVFLDGASGNFNSVPSLTRGCEDTYCTALTPFSIPAVTQVNTYSAPNWIPPTTSDAFTFLKNEFHDTTTNSSQVYAVWQAAAPPSVPMSSTLAMLGLLALLTGTGLIGTLRWEANSRP